MTCQSLITGSAVHETVRTVQVSPGVCRGYGSSGYLLSGRSVCAFQGLAPLFFGVGVVHFFLSPASGYLAYGFSPPKFCFTSEPVCLDTERRRQSSVPFSGHYPVRSVDAALAVVREEESNRLGSGVLGVLCVRLPTWRLQCIRWFLCLQVSATGRRNLEVL
jgi:hypothetical protein